MPRYFFTVSDRGMSKDDVGTECSDVYAAQAEAVRTIGQMLQEHAECICDGSDWRMEVTDHQDRIIFVARVSIDERIHADKVPYA